MCILKAFSNTQSFKIFAKQCSLPVYSVYDKGEKLTKYRVSQEYRISFIISELEWDDFKGQAKETIAFLSNYFNELHEFLNMNGVVDAYLDFPIYSRLDDEILNQNDYLPKKLINLAGRLNLGIEMSIYSKEIE